MSPGHLSVPVHAMHAMFQVHAETLRSASQTLRLSRPMDWDWLYFHVPGTSISPYSFYACHVPGTYRYLYILFQNSPFVKAQGFRLIIFSYLRKIYQSLFILCMPCPRDIHVPLHSVSKLTVSQGAWIEIDNIFMAPGHQSVPVHAMHAMSQGHTRFKVFIGKYNARNMFNQDTKQNKTKHIHTHKA